MIKAIIFDFWGTLANEGIESPIKQVKNILRLRLPFHEYVVRFEHAFMTKSFPELKEGFTAVCQEFGLEGKPWLIEQMVGLWNKNWLLGRFYEETSEVLEELKGKYKLVLISNSDCFSVKNMMEKFGLKKYFGEIYLSYEVGLIKTDPGFFPNLLEKLNLKPEECLVVGDSILSDMTAKEHGLKVVLVDRKGTREFEPKINNLKELKEIINKF